MKKSGRLLKVLSGIRPRPRNRRGVPRINLEGRWLERLGFTEGEKVAVVVQPKRLVITVEDKYDKEKIHRRILDLTKVDPGDVIVQYKDLNDNWRKEIIKVEKAGRYYRITSIPYKLTGLALGDLIKADEQFGHLFFNRVVRYGPNQTIQVQLRDAKFADEQLLKVIKLLDCEAIQRLNGRITINIPMRADCRELLRYLDEVVRQGYWDYRKPYRGAL